MKIKRKRTKKEAIEGKESEYSMLEIKKGIEGQRLKSIIILIVEYRDIQPLTLFRHSKEYQALKGFEPNDPKVEGYKLWVHLFCDTIGYSTYILYPTKTKEGEKIKVLFHGLATGYIEWIHGEIGLFKEKIVPLLLSDEQIN